MAKNHSIGIVLTLILIVAGLLGLFGYQSIPDLFDKIPKENSEPFLIKLSPEYFDEGNYDYYDKIPFSMEISQKSGRNITFLELAESNFKVSREDNGLNKPTSQVNWKNSRSQNIFSFGYSTYSYSHFTTMEAEGEMSTCKNCFIGNEYPYVFTFTIYYKEDEGELKSKTFRELIPIK